MQQLLVGQSQLVQMMSQNMTNNENNQPQIHHDNKEIQIEVVTTLRACKTCGEIGHTSKECHDEWPDVDAPNSTEGYPTTQVS